MDQISNQFYDIANTITVSYCDTAIPKGETLVSGMLCVHHHSNVNCMVVSKLYGLITIYFFLNTVLLLLTVSPKLMWSTTGRLKLNSLEKS